METMGERVRRLRLEADNMTQEALAAQVPGMTASAISQLENGNSKGVKPENLLHLAKALGVSMHELVTGKPDPRVPIPKRVHGKGVGEYKAAIGREDSPQEAQLLAAFRKAKPELRAALLTLASALGATS